MAREVKIAILGDSRDFMRAVDRVSGGAGRLNRALGGIAKGAAIGLGAAAVGVAAIGGSAVKSLMRIEKIAAQTDAALKSTGGAAGVTRKQIDDLAGSIEAMSGVEAEAITEGQNLLLTFTKIQNKAGKGNDIFDQATQAMVDMSVAMGTDMKSSSLLVGKALNDPIKGVTALSRAGIQFTDKQKETIKRMVELGDVAGAQKIVLKELNTQFGGSAKALGGTLQGRIERVKHQFGTMTETLAARLMPVAEKVVAWAADKMPGAMAAAERAFQRVGEIVGPIAEGVREFAEKAGPPIQAWVDDVLATMAAWWDDHGPTILTVIDTLRAGVEEAFRLVVEAGKFVVEHWDEFKIAAGVLVAVMIPHYVSLATAAVASAATQAASWVATQVAAVAAAAVHSAQVLIMIAGWAAMAAKAVFHAAVIAGGWVLTQIAAMGATTRHGVAVAAQVAGWGTLSAASVRHSGIIAASWARALGPLGLVAGGGFAAADFLGDKTGKGTHLSILERLNPFKAFEGMSFSLPGFAQGGLVPGGLGQPMPILAHGGEMVVTPGQQKRGGGQVAFPSHVTLVVDGQQFAARVYADGRAQAGRRGVA